MKNEIIEFEEKEEGTFTTFLLIVWSKIKYYFSHAAPYIVLAIHTLIFESARIIRNFFKYALRQIKLED